MKALCLISVLATLILVDCKQDLDYVIYDLSKAEELFAEFRHNFGKHYSSQKETERRYKIFVHNLKQINKINSQHLTWVAGINQFADMTNEEVKKCCLGLKPPKQDKLKRKKKPRTRTVILDSSFEDSKSK